MAIIFNEGFETDGNGTRYTTSTPEFSDGSADFFTRTDGANIGSFYEVAGVVGTSYFAAQDIDGEGAASVQTLSFTGIDIAGFESLSFSALFAEDQSGDGNEDWDANDFVRVSYRIDSGAFQPVFAIENDGSTSNSAPFVDTDLDGTGDGAEITDTFTRYGVPITGSGSLLDIEIAFRLEAGDEDIAIDDITVEGTSMASEVVVLDEGFETDGNGTRYTTSVPEFSDGAGDFFTRTDGSNIGGFYEVTGQGGDFWFAAQDIDGEGAASQQVVEFTGLDIAGLSDLSFSAKVAEDDDGTNQDWDLSDFVKVEYRIDGGDFRTLLAIESVPDGDNFNAVPAVDTDLDGNGDAPEITSAFQTLTAAIAETGSVLDLRITFDLDSGDEDLSIDDIRIVGQSGGTTPPAVLALSGDGLTVSEEGATTDTFTLQLATDPSAPVTVTAIADGQTELSLDGVTFAQSVDVDLSDAASLATLTVRAIDDGLDETDPHAGEIAFAVASADPAYDGLGLSPLSVEIGDNDVTLTKIHAIQGAGDASPLDGQEVTVEAIVTGLFYEADGGVNGFWVQEEDADADGDAATSEGIFVFSRDATVSVGDKVQVTGIVDERFGQTQIAEDAVKVIDSGNPLPMAVAITLGIGPDFEPFEGMRVELMSAPGADPLTVVTNFNLDRFGEIQVAEGNLIQPTQIFDPNTQAAEIAALTQANAEGRLIIDDSTSGSNPDTYRLLEGPDGTPVTPTNFDPAAPQLRLGTELADITGIMDFGFGAYRLQVAEPLETLGGNPRPEEAPEVGGDLKVASFNVLNYFTSLDDATATNPAGQARGATSEFDLARQTEKLVNALTAIDADIIGLQEIENNGFGNGSAIATLVEALNAATAPGTYAFVEPAGLSDGFIGTDAITAGLIYKTDAVTVAGEAKVLVFEEASAAQTLEVTSALEAFVSSDDQVGDFQRNRPAVAATFEDADGNQVTVVSNHFKSKGDSNLEDTLLDAQRAGAPQELIDALLADPNYDQGDGQGFWNQVRADAAAELAAWLETNPTGADDTSNVLVLGDLNAYAKEDPVKNFLDAGLSDLAQDFIGPDAYSFVFDGQRGTLDYGLASAGLLDNITGVAEWHIAADEPDFLNYSSEFKDAAYFNADDFFAASDHDPLIIGLDLDEAPATALARLDFVDRLFRDKVVYSVDGELIDSQKLRFLSRDIEVAEAGITIDADDGLRFSPSFLTTFGEGLGVRSVRGDKFFGREKTTLDDRETISFALEEAGGLGDALDVQFEFATVKGRGEVELTFFDDGAEIDSVWLAVEDRSVAYALDEDLSFDRVEIGTTGNLRLSLDAVEFLRLDLEEDVFAFV
jgi:predicted extracellular nuclease